MTLAPEPTGTVRIRAAEDLLALIPHQLGHRPRDASVLFFPMPAGRALCLSVDTPGSGHDPTLIADELRDALGHVVHRGEVVVVVYSEGEDGRSVSTTAGTLDRWRAVTKHAGLHLLRLLVVGPTHWWDAEEPEHPMPAQLITDSAVNAQLVAMGSAAEPGLLRADPVWGRRLQPRGRRVRDGRPEPGPPAREQPLEKDSGARRPGAGHGAEVRDRARVRLALWDDVVARVGRRRQRWVEAVLESTDGELVELVAALRDDLTRDALLYSWLTGSTDRALTALGGLQAAANRMEGGGPKVVEPGPEVLDEALRCLTTVSGEWEGPPHWDTVDSAHRVLQVLDALLQAAGGGPPVPRAEGTDVIRVSPQPGSRATGAEQRSQIVPAGEPRPAPSEAPALTVTAVLAQLEQYRGRARTAARMLRDAHVDLRCREGRRSASSDVLRRLSLLPTPWWCSDHRTAWPGRRAWTRGTT